MKTRQAIIERLKGYQKTLDDSEKEQNHKSTWAEGLNNKIIKDSRMLLRELYWVLDIPLCDNCDKEISPKEESDYDCMCEACFKEEFASDIAADQEGIHKRLDE